MNVLMGERLAPKWAVSEGRILGRVVLLRSHAVTIYNRILLLLFVFLIFLLVGCILSARV